MPDTFVPGFENLPQVESVSPASQTGTEGASQTTPNPTGVNGGEQNVPYGRFNEVIQERNTLRDQFNQQQALLQQVLTQQNTAAGQGAREAVQEAQRQTALLSDEEIQRYSEQVLVDPGRTLLEYGQLIQERAVRPAVEQAVQAIRQEFSPYAQQFNQLRGDTAVDQFRARALANPASQAVTPYFNQLVDDARRNAPDLLTSDQGLQVLYRNAVGQAVIEGKVNPATFQAPRLDSPGSNPSNPFGAFGAPAAPQSDPRDLAIARRFGMTDEETTQLLNQMEVGNVFRQR